MLHNQESKSKGEKRNCREQILVKLKGRRCSLAFLLSAQSLGYLVSFLANEGGHVEIVRTPLHHGPR